MILDRVINYLIGWLIGWQRALQALSHGGRLFRLGVDTVLAPCNRSLSWIYIDVSMRRHRLK
jgi:hypothetical protein